MSWLFWCIVIVILLELVIQYCIIRAAYPVLFAPMPGRLDLAGSPDDLLEQNHTIQIEHVEFSTTNGLILRGFIATPKKSDPQGLILFCHPFKSSGAIALSQCRALLQAGFAVFSFDFRNHGESDIDLKYQAIHWLSKHEINDVKSAIHFIRTQSKWAHLQLGLLGMSRGAGAALVVAAQSSQIQFVACEGAFANEDLFLDHAIRWGERFVPRWFIQLVPTWEVVFAFRIMLWYSQKRQGCQYVNLKPYLSSLRDRDLLFLVGEKDQSVVPRMTELITRKIHDSRITVCSVPDAIHNAGRNAQPQQYDSALLHFFSQMSVGDSPQPVSNSEKQTKTEPELVSGDISSSIY